MGRTWQCRHPSKAHQPAHIAPLSRNHLCTCRRRSRAAGEEMPGGQGQVDGNLCTLAAVHWAGAIARLLASHQLRSPCQPSQPHTHNTRNRPQMRKKHTMYQ